MPFPRWLFPLVLLASNAFAEPLSVVTTVPDLRWLVERIGGDAVKVQSLLRGTENPHYSDAVPSFIHRVASAKAVVFVGLELEVGWLPKVLAKSGNAAVQPGGLGYCDASRTVQVLEKPAAPVDRSQGDVHPFGNSHYWLGPLAMAEAAESVGNCLAAVDPAHAPQYQASAKETAAELRRLRDELRTRLAPVRARSFLEYHKEFVYFFSAYELKSNGSLEEKPGIPPSAGRIAQVALAAKAQKVALLLAGQWAPKGQLDRFHELSGVPVAVLPTSLGSATGKDAYAAWQRGLVDRLLEATQAKKL